MSFSEKLEELFEHGIKYWDNPTERYELEDKAKDLVKEEIRLWMDEHGIQGKIVMRIHLGRRYTWYGVEKEYAYSGPIKVDLGYVSVWNNNYATGRYRGWLNKLNVSIRGLKYYRDDDMQWTTWSPMLRHFARTDPAFVGEDIGHSFEGRVLNLLEEMNAAAKRTAPR